MIHREPHRLSFFVFALKTASIMRKEHNLRIESFIHMEEITMEIKINVNAMAKQETKKETRWVTSSDGVRMTYEEWLEMRRSEMY